MRSNPAYRTRFPSPLHDAARAAWRILCKLLLVAIVCAIAFLLTVG
jgi:hypothetical protein